MIAVYIIIVTAQYTQPCTVSSHMDDFDDLDSFSQSDKTPSKAQSQNEHSSLNDMDFLGDLGSPNPAKQESQSQVDLDFLSDLQSSNTPSSTTGADINISNSSDPFDSSVEPSNTASADLDFLSEMDKSPAAIQATPPNVTSSFEPVETDFMAWLDDPDSTPSKLSPSVAQLPSKKQVDSAEGEGINDFLEEVFGETGPTQVVTSSTSSSLSGNKKYEAELRAESSSGFPDISKLRSMVLRGGYLPHVSRGHVWCILLTGGPCVDDQEAEFWKPHGGSDENIGNKSQLESDCLAALSRLENTMFAPTDTEQSREDLHDILLLYCMRRNTSYSSLMCDLLSPLLVLAPPLTPLSRALASACFYSMHSEFIPTANLQVRSLIFPHTLPVRSTFSYN
jgi:hypothetical protein